MLSETQTKNFPLTAGFAAVELRLLNDKEYHHSFHNTRDISHWLKIIIEQDQSNQETLKRIFCQIAEKIGAGGIIRLGNINSFLNKVRQDLMLLTEEKEPQFLRVSQLTAFLQNLSVITTNNRELAPFFNL